MTAVEIRRVAGVTAVALVAAMESACGGATHAYDFNRTAACLNSKTAYGWRAARPPAVRPFPQRWHVIGVVSTVASPDGAELQLIFTKDAAAAERVAAAVATAHAATPQRPHLVGRRENVVFLQLYETVPRRLVRLTRTCLR